MTYTKSFYASQPGKGVWIAFVIASSFIWLPFLAIYFIPKPLRPHPKWTYRQALTNELSKLFFGFASTVEYRTAQSLEPGSEKERFVVMPKMGQDMYIGCLEDEEIQPGATGGMWLPSSYVAARDQDKKVFLHFHGGAYVILSPRDPNVLAGPDALCQRLSAMALCLDYRLASNPQGRFPAALQDALTSYKYLLDLKIPSSQILFSGDSAGAHLALSLLRYLTENEGLLPVPSGVLLWSPWLDLASDPNLLDRHRNSRTDYITSAFIGWGIRAFVPSFMERSHPYITPLQHPFSTRTPIWIQVGESEVLCDEGIRFARSMEGIPGNTIGLCESPNAPHDIFAAGTGLGFERERAEAIDSAWQFMRRQWG